MRKTTADFQLPMLVIVVVLPLLVSYIFYVGDRYTSRREFVYLKQHQDAQAVAAFVQSWLDDATVLGASIAANTRFGRFESEELPKYLASAADLIPRFESIFAMDAKGRLYGKAISLARKGNLKRVLDVARYSMGSGESEIVTLYPKGDSTSTVVVIYPVHRATERVAGVVVILASIEFLLRDLISLREGELSQYTITDATGRVVMSTDSSIKAGSRYPIGSRRLLIGSYHIPHIGWTAYVAVPLNKAMAPIYKGALRVLAVVCVSLLLAVVLARWFWVRFVRPLKQLETTVTERLVRAQEGERQRLAREIHDWINEHLVGMFYRLQAIGPDAAMTALDDVSQQLKTANIELRRIMNDLHPHLLEEEGLSAAFKAHASEFEARTGIMCRLDISVDESQLSNRHKLTLFRLLQEALANVRKHAGARVVYVSLTDAGGDVNLTVSDDGVGFDVSAVKPGGLGLVSMRERAAALGGRLDITSTPGRGTVVESQIPK